MSLAYTWTDATENRIFSGNFSLDYPTIEGYGVHAAAEVPKHRLVVTGTYDLPWDVLFSGKLTLESDAPFQYTDCLAGDNQCVLRRLKPEDSDLRQLDLSLTKQFRFGFLPNDSSFRVRLDVLNVFNRRNWRNFDLFPGNLDGPNPNFGSHQQDVYTTRTAKVSFGFDW